MLGLNKDERGHTLVLIVIFIAVFAVLGVAMFSYSINQRKSSLAHGRNIEAYYVAKSGAEAVKARLIQPDADVSSYIGTTVDGDIDGKDFSVDISTSGDNLVLTSTGEVPSGSGTLEEKVVLVIPGSSSSSTVEISSAIFSSELPTISGNSGSIIGGITISQPDDGSFTQPSIVDEVDYKEGLSYPNIVFPTFPTLSYNGPVTFESNKAYINIIGDYGNVDFASNGKDNLYIESSASPTELIFNNLNINGGNVYMPDTLSKLTLYISNGFTTGGGELLSYKQENPEASSIADKDKLSLYYRGSEELILNNSGFPGNYYIEDAPVTVGDQGSKLDLNINVFTNSDKPIKITGNTTINGIIYAPNATVEVAGTMELNGAIVANQFKLTGGADILYPASGEDSILTLPDEVKVVKYQFNSAYWRD